MPGTGGSVHDVGLRHRHGMLWVPYNEFSYTLTEGTPNLITTLGAGTPAVGEVSVAAAELAGLRMDTADEAYAFVAMPRLIDFDETRDLQMRVLWESGKAGATANVDWLAWMKGLALDQVLSDAKVTADAALVYAAAGSASPGLLKATEWKPANAPGVFADDFGIMLAVELDDRGDAAADDVRLMGVQLKYTKRTSSLTGVRELT